MTRCLAAVVSDHTESLRYGVCHRIESLQLAARLARGELPSNAAPVLIAFGFHRRDLTTQRR
ncbi:MAG TPA: hypothetical protein VIY29_14455 [Ktedonobacteraceae bacterium]